MKKLLASTHLNMLQTDTRRILAKMTYLQQLPPNRLEQQPGPGRWSVGQIVEHLNTYGRFYLPKLEEGISKATRPATEYFVPGWLGGYFTKSMMPKPDGTIPRKMKAFKNHTPAPGIDALKAMQEFEQQEVWLLQLLDKAKTVDINCVRIPISIAPYIKLKMGDVFDFNIAHHHRHFLQIDNTLKAMNQLANYA